MHAARCLLLTGCMLLVVLPVHGQRIGIMALQDSLGGETDVPRLYRMERALPMPAVAPDSDAIIRRGLTALRIWELTGDRDDATRALDTFETGATRFPGEAWPHYGVGLALAHGPDVRLPLPGRATDGIVIGQSLAEIFRRDPRSRARRALRRALELDGAFAPAAALLGELAVADGGRNRTLIAEARDALLHVRASGGSTPESERALANMEIALGNYRAAGAAAGAAGRDAAALHMQAVTLLLQPGAAAEGDALYWRGVELLDGRAADAYYADLELLATPAEVADWSVADVQGRRLWLERFWQRRAAEGGVTTAERLAEHYSRLTGARQRFLRNSTRGADGAGVLLTEDQSRHPFDDRGLVLLRHGEPLRTLSTAGRGLLPNETWVYDLPDHGLQLFHFVSLRGSQSYLLVSDLLQALDPTAMTYLDERERAVMALISDRAQYEPRYQAILQRLSRVLQQFPPVDLRGTEVRSMLEQPDADYRRGARAALRTDSHVRTYAGDLAFHHDVFSFRTPTERTDLTAAFAIPTRQLEPLAGSGGSEYAVRLSVILHDTLQDVVTRRDTVQRVRLAEPSRDGYIRMHVTLPVVPSEHTVYRLVAEDEIGGRGRLEAGGSVLRDYSGADLLVSDIVLAHPDAVGDWRRGDLVLALALPRSFPPERPFAVFYEVYNIPENAPFSTRITVAPVTHGGIRGRLGRLFGGGPGEVDLRFEDKALLDSSGVLQQTRQVAGDLPAGLYEMTITVSTGNRAARSTTVFRLER
jgi:hypothetical protein